MRDRLTIKKLRELKDEGLSDREIGERYGMTFREVWRLRRDNDVYTANGAQYAREARRFAELIDDEKLSYLRGEPTQHSFW